MTPALERHHAALALALRRSRLERDEPARPHVRAILDERENLSWWRRPPDPLTRARALHEVAG